MMRMILISVLAATTLSGCGCLCKMQRPKAAPVQIVAPVEPAVTLPALGAGHRRRRWTKAVRRKAAAVAKPASGARVLGKAVVALGSPAEQGFWLKSALVVTAGKGRVVTAGGSSVNVDLIPGEGAALLSLAAFRALGLGLTDLPEVTVYAE